MLNTSDFYQKSILIEENHKINWDFKQQNEITKNMLVKINVLHTTVSNGFRVAFFEFLWSFHQAPIKMDSFSGYDDLAGSL